MWVAIFLDSKRWRVSFIYLFLKNWLLIKKTSDGIKPNLYSLNYIYSEESIFHDSMMKQ